MVTHQLQVKRRTGKVRRPETDVLPLCHATNLVANIIIGLLTFGSQGLYCTYTIHAFIHTYTENKTELCLLKVDEHINGKKNICNE